MEDVSSATRRGVLSGAVGASVVAAAAALSSGESVAAAATPPVVMTHLGLTISDYDRTVLFYGGLGFKPMFGGDLTKSDLTNRINNVVGMGDRANVSFFNPVLVLEGFPFMIELLLWKDPKPIAASVLPKPFNSFGLVHLSFTVPDAPAMLKRLVSLGGKHLPERDFNGPLSDAMKKANQKISITFLTDPDGQLVELIQVI